MKEPPRQAELPGKDKITVPVEKPPKMEMQQVKKEPDPVAQLNIPARACRGALDSLPGAIEAPPGPPTLRRAPAPAAARAREPAAASARHRLGPRARQRRRHRRRRLSAGQRRDAARACCTKCSPQYTSDAMRAKVQGTVLLECVVRPDGSVGDVQVVRSLDPTFGLDQQAVPPPSSGALRPARASANLSRS